MFNQCPACSSLYTLEEQANDCFSFGKTTKELKSVLSVSIGKVLIFSAEDGEIFFPIKSLADWAIGSKCFDKHFFIHGVCPNPNATISVLCSKDFIESKSPYSIITLTEAVSMGFEVANWREWKNNADLIMQQEYQAAMINRTKLMSSAEKKFFSKNNITPPGMMDPNSQKIDLVQW